MSGHAEKMNNEVKELLVLLRGSVKAGRMAGAAISEAATEDDLPELVHELIAGLLLSSAWATRANASHTLRLLSRRFASHLAPMLLSSSSEGSMLSLDDIDLPRLLQEGAGVELLAGGDPNESENASDVGTHIYGKGWLQRQKRELRRRLGMESGGTDVASAVSYDDSTDVLVAVDVRTTSRRIPARSDNDDSLEKDEIENKSVNENVMNPSLHLESSESWLARLVRFMCVGLLAARWETRHGSAMGLAALWNGLTCEDVAWRALHPAQDASQQISAADATPLPLALADFLASDLQATGVLLLALDRFVDFGRRGAAAAPVKEAAAQLISIAAYSPPRSVVRDKITLLKEPHLVLLGMALQLAGHAGMWGVRQGGLLLLRYLLPVHFRSAGLLDRTGLSLQVQQALLAGLGDPVEDVRGAAAQAVGALALCMGGSPTRSADPQPDQSLHVVVRALAVACMQITNMSVIVADYARALSSAARALPCIIAATTSTEERLTWLSLCSELYCGAAALAARQALFALSLRALCIQSISESVHRIFNFLSALVGTARDESLRRATEHALASALHLLCVVLATSPMSSARALGDLHLVDKAEQDREQEIGEADSWEGREQEGADAGAEGELAQVDEHEWQLRRRQHEKERKAEEDVAAEATVVLGAPLGRSLQLLWQMSNSESSPILHTWRAPLLAAALSELCTTSEPCTVPPSSPAVVPQVDVRVPLRGKGRGKGKKKDEDRFVDVPDDFETITALLPGSLPALLQWLCGMASSTAHVWMPALVAATARGLRAAGIQVLDKFIAGSTGANQQRAYSGAGSMALARLVCTTVIDSAAESALLRQLLHAQLHEIVQQGNLVREEVRMANHATEYIAPQLCIVLVTSSGSHVSHGVGASRSVDSGVPMWRVLHVEVLAAALALLPASAVDASSAANQLPGLQSQWGHRAQEQVRYCYRIAGFSTDAAAIDSTMLPVPAPEGAPELRRLGAVSFASRTPLLMVQVHELASQAACGSTAAARQARACLRALAVAPDPLQWLLPLLFALLPPVDDLDVTRGCDDSALAGLEHALAVLSAAAPCLLSSPRNRLLQDNTLALATRLLRLAISHPASEVGHAEQAAWVLAELLWGSFPLASTSVPAAVPTDAERWVVLIPSLSVLDASVRGTAHISTHAAAALLTLVQCGGERCIHGYTHYLGVALAGAGAQLEFVRDKCMQCLRLLVPLAPLARRALAEINSRSDIATIILSRAAPPDLQHGSAADAALAAVLRSTLQTQQPAVGPDVLRPYQWAAISWLLHLWRAGLSGILADDMGLGKTLQALAAIAFQVLEQRQQGQLQPLQASLVVCPAAVCLHWLSEVRKFFPPSLLRAERYQPQQHCTSAALDMLAASAPGHLLLIMSYGDLRTCARDSDEGAPHRRRWKHVLLDEAHLVKNPRSSGARAAFALSAEHRTALSGTPIQNHVQELWALLHFVVPGVLGPWEPFQKHVVRPVSKYFESRRQLQLQTFWIQQQQRGSQGPSSTADQTRGSAKPNTSLASQLSKFRSAVDASATGLDVLRRLHAQVLPFLLRRTKDAVATELPAKLVVDVPCPLTSLQQELYVGLQRGLSITDDTLEQRLHRREGSMPIAAISSPVAPMQAFALLRLLCVHPGLVTSSAHAAYRHRLLQQADCSGKLRELARLLVDTGVVGRLECTKHWADLCGTTEADEGGGAEEHADSDDAAEEDGASDDSEEEEEDEEAEEKSDKEVQTGSKRTRSQAMELRERLLRNPRSRRDSTSGGANTTSTTTSTHSHQPHRCLLFAQHRAVLDVVERTVLRPCFPTLRYARLDGSMDPATRGRVAAAFNAQQDEQQSDGGLRLLLLTARASGLGLNLTAADTVIFLEHDWNPFVDLQAMDRAHRLGQRRQVTVYRLLAAATIEARIMSTQAAKTQVVDEVITAANAGALMTSSDTATEVPSLGQALWSSMGLAVGHMPVGSTTGGWSDEEYESLDLDRFLADIGVEADSM